MDNDWYSILVALAGFSAVVLVVFTGLLLYGVRNMVRPGQRDALAPPARERPGVTVLKPCAGRDDGLEACLETFFHLEYPRYQIVFGVRDASDPAYPLLRALIARHPERDAEVVFSAAGRSPNPKVANLEVMATRARYDLLWISDSNTMVHPDTLAAMVDDVEAPGVGVVVSPVIGVGERTAGAALENLQLSAYAATGTFAVWVLLGRVTAPGKSMLLHRRNLERMGGFAWLGRHLAEDFVMCERLRTLGLRNVIGRHAVANLNATGTVQRFLDRHQRWTQLRWLIATPTTVLEPLLSPMTATGLLVLCAPSAHTLAMFGAAAALHLVLDLAAMRAIRGTLPALRYWPLVCARPLFHVWLWARASLDRRVVWRGNARWLGANSTILAEPPMRARLRAIRNAVVRS